jgi:eukaryotic-like serine/threonine-protein kinase
MSLNQSTSLGKYRIIAELGHGGMADVYLAVVKGPVGFNKLQVIKQLRPHLAEVPDFLAMFLDEARLAARLNHPNVVQTNEVVEDGQRYFIAMEYLDGQSLDRVLRKAQKDQRLTLPMRLKIISDVLSGLHHAHELCDFDGTPLSVVHRDVTPHNVFVTYDGQVKVVDFGIAKAANCSAETRTGVLKGKIAYMAPEQAQGDSVDRRADLFSVGLMIWECICDARPWKGLTDIQVLNRLGQGQFPSLREAKPDVPPELERIVLKATALNRDERYATAAEMQTELDHYLERSGARVTTRDVGKLVSEMYQEKRAEIRALIEAQLRDAKTTQTGAFPIAAMPRLDSTASIPTPSGPASGPIPNVSGQRPGDDEPTSAATPLGRTGSTSASRAAMSTSLPDTPPPRRSPALLVVGGIMVLGAAAAALVMVRGNTDPPLAASTSASAPASAVASGVPSPNPTTALAELTARAMPTEARLFLDDAPLPGNPSTLKLPRDGASHKLRAEAPGYVAKTELITMSGDVSAQLQLDQAAEPDTKATTAVRGPLRLGGASPPPATATATTGDPVAPPRVQKPKRRLDDDDPWAKK